MSQSFKLPDLGEGIHEGEVLAIPVSVGQEIKEGDIILEVETDKAAVEIPSPYTGRVEEILVKPGDVVNVGDVMMTFSGGKEAEDVKEQKQIKEPPSPAEAVTAAPHSSPMANHQVTPAVQPPLSIAVPTKEEFQSALIQIASDSTGFDPEMLSLNSNMETDLGIDSIKKVEIFSLLRERFDMMNQLDEDLLIEEVAELTTLGSVVEWFQGKLEQSTTAGISQAPDMSTQPLSYSDSSF